MINTRVSSPIRWAGSKMTILNELLSQFDDDKTIYIEPFLGSGSVLLNVLNDKEKYRFHKYYVNDINGNIITFYKTLKSDNLVFIKQLYNLTEKYNTLDSIDEKERMYYEIRSAFNQDDTVEKSDLFYFLMKAGFNGVYRENSKGKFNVPFGRKERLTCDIDKIQIVSKLIKSVHFYNLEWDSFLDEMGKREKLNDTLIYCDPPYIPEDESVYQKQTLYSKNSFDHSKFCDYIKGIKSDNNRIIISMSDSIKANSIYYDNDVFEKKEIKDISRIINPRKRLDSKEIIYKTM